MRKNFGMTMMILAAIIIAMGPVEQAMAATAATSQAVFLQVNQPPSASASSTAVYVGDSITITADGTGTGTYSYAWGTTAGTGSVSLANIGQSTVTATGVGVGECTVVCTVDNDSGAMDTQIVTITVLAVPTISIQIASVGGANMLNPAQTSSGYEVNVLPSGALLFTAVSDAPANTSFTSCVWKKNGVTLAAGATQAANGLSDNIVVSFPAANTMLLTPTHVDAQELDTNSGYTVDATIVATP